MERDDLLTELRRGGVGASGPRVWGQLGDCLPNRVNSVGGRRAGPCVRLPQWLLRGRGKDIQGAVQGALGFPFHVAPLTKTLPLVPLVPTELADTLRRIATS